MEFKVLKVFFILAMFFVSSVFAAEPALNAQTPMPTQPQLSAIQSTKYSLTQITGLPDVDLTGKEPVYKFFLPISKAQKISSINLHLIMSPSPLLTKDSTLTLIANDMPINSSKLDNTNAGLSWDIQLPNELLTSDMIVIKIVGLLKITEDACVDIENPGNWLKISGNSIVDYNFVPVTNAPTLENLADTFLQKELFSPGKLVFSWPNSPSPQNLQQLLSIMNKFTKVISWRGLYFSLINQNNLQTDKKDASIVMVGTLSQLQLDNFGFKLPLKLTADNQLTTLIDEPINADRGIIMIIPSPWFPQQSVLILTGQNQQAVNKAVKELDSLLSDKVQTTSNFLIIDKNTVTKTVSHTTFKSRGYDNQIVYGDGLHNISYSFFVDKYLPISANVELKYGYPTDSALTRLFSLTLKANGTPVDNLVLSKDHTPAYITKTIPIPNELLFVGNNRLDIKYDFYNDHKFCNRFGLSFLWGNILNSSKINITYSDEMAANQLSQVKNLLSGNTVLSLPNNSYFYNDIPFIYQLLRFVYINSNITKIKLTQTQEIDQTILKDNNLIYFGDINTNTWLKNHISFEQKFYDYPRIASLVLTNSPMRTSKILIISSKNIPYYSEILQSLNNKVTNKKMTGDTVLFSKNKTFLSLNTIRETYSTAVYNEVKRNWVHYLIIGIIFLFFIVSLAYFLHKKRD